MDRCDQLHGVTPPRSPPRLLSPCLLSGWGFGAVFKLRNNLLQHLSHWHPVPLSSRWCPVPLSSRWYPVVLLSCPLHTEYLRLCQIQISWFSFFFSVCLLCYLFACLPSSLSPWLQLGQQPWRTMISGMKLTASYSNPLCSELTHRGEAMRRAVPLVLC